MSGSMSCLVAKRFVSYADRTANDPSIKALEQSPGYVEWSAYFRSQFVADPRSPSGGGYTIVCNCGPNGERADKCCLNE